MLTGEKMSASKKEYQQAKIMSTGRKKCQNTKKCQQAAPLDNEIFRKNKHQQNGFLMCNPPILTFDGQKSHSLDDNVGDYGEDYQKDCFSLCFFYQNMGKSISLCTMAVNEGPGIRARGSSSRASWHDFPTFHGDHHEVEHQEEWDD